jgi:hypothetical protein
MVVPKVVEVLPELPQPQVEHVPTDQPQGVENHLGFQAVTHVSFSIRLWRRLTVSGSLENLFSEGPEEFIHTVRPILFVPDPRVDLLKSVDAGGGFPVKGDKFSGGLRLLQGLVEGFKPRHLPLRLLPIHPHADKEWLSQASIRVTIRSALSLR